MSQSSVNGGRWVNSCFFYYERASPPASQPESFQLLTRPGPRLFAAHDVFVVLIVNFPSKQEIAKGPRRREKKKKKPSTPPGARTSKDEAGKGQKKKRRSINASEVSFGAPSSSLGLWGSQLKVRSLAGYQPASLLASCALVTRAGMVGETSTICTPVESMASNPSILISVAQATYELREEKEATTPSNRPRRHTDRRAETYDILTTEGNNPLWVFYRMGHNHFTVGHASFAGVENRFGSISLSEMGISIRIRKQLII
ncbi:uncharacterized protein LAJ45_04339 [Morchella importuna]|uniref:uncharacterized protein n=1 Tax=Morchella importuna TaxID=1174673 RepID=UPI001E8DFB31|nr:uncharacterized protein LAJ45_04339 [Morchella importuna]KAH8151717.1 hypothetical protein LAJ45_04339 [Morchella importuna]